MQLWNISVKNFRLLHGTGLLLEKQTTVIVGRNNMIFSSHEAAPRNKSIRCF